ncbi:MAG: hypothetical protein IT379_02690 [Deltaproteobacteria bacterium]|nr:hypothetical protein [Deltaproteobacteria bacterium]
MPDPEGERDDDRAERDADPAPAVGSSDAEASVGSEAEPVPPRSPRDGDVAPAPDRVDSVAGDAGGSWRAKLPIAIALACVGVWRACSAGPMGSDETEPVAAVAALLERTTGARFATDETAIVTNAGGLVEDAALGRVVIGLGRRPGKKRDLYVADVRFAGDRPYSVAWWRNVSASPDADESSLVVGGGRAAFAVTSLRGVEVVTAVDLRGEPSPAGEWTDRFFARAQAWMDTGLLDGIRRVSVDLAQPMRAPRVALRGPRLVVEEGARRVDIDLRRPPERVAHARVIEHRRPPRSPVLWAVDTVRGVVGKGPIAWLESTVFSAQDRVRGMVFDAQHSSSDRTTQALSVEEVTRARKSRPLPPELTRGGAVWPPEPVTLRFRSGEPGEGAWRDTTPSWVRRIDGAPPFAYLTFIRPDPERPWVRVHLLALDPRQIEIGMEAGAEDPRPTTGAPSEGRIPRERDVLDRVVAAFNGAFKSEHGNYGMQVNGRLFLPPVAGAASITSHIDGRIGFGTWGPDTAVPPDVRSFRQNLSALVEGDRINPEGRAHWGYVLGVAGAGEMPTERTALCRHRDGYVLYAWGEGVTGTGLAEATLLAGCDYAMHLDMNPLHCVWEWLRVEGGAANQARHAYLAPGMRGNPRRFLRWYPKDFFYVTLRRAGAPPSQTLAWNGSIIRQPEPAWLPAIFHARVDRVGGPPTHVVSVQQGRVRFVTRPGRRDDRGHSAGPRARSLRGSLFATEISAQRRAGFRSGGGDVSPLSPELATVLLGTHVRVLRPGVLPPRDVDDLLQGELVLADGELAPNVTPTTWERAAGIGVTADGRVVMAAGWRLRVREVGAALREAGAVEGVAFTGADGARGNVRIPSREEPLRQAYEGRAVYAIGVPMGHPTFRFGRDAE